MEIQVLGSGSKGNCYLLSDTKTKILLECGLPIKKIQSKLNFGLSSIDACLLTHEHKDHSFALSEIILRGINVYSSKGTLSALRQNCTPYAHIMKPLSSHTIGSFIIMPFPVEHDSEEPFGYLIYSNFSRKKLVFLTDTSYCKYVFKNLTHIMVECNYVKFEAEDALFSRVSKTHMGLDTCLNFLESNDLSKVELIMLIHLSEERGDPAHMIKEVQKKTGCQVIVANSV